jgi:hypothetical protein
VLRLRRVEIDIPVSDRYSKVPMRCDLSFHRRSLRHSGAHPARARVDLRQDCARVASIPGVTRPNGMQLSWSRQSRS